LFSRRHRATTRGQTADRPRESRRTDRYRGRARLHRRDQRSTLPRVQRSGPAQSSGSRSSSSAHAVPITYLGADGKQYVAIVAAGASAIDGGESPEAQALVAFALP
jgi:hypothetical protein